MIECPYDHHHKVREDRIEAHIMKCQWRHANKNFVICPFNFKHHMPKSDYETHALNCPDRHNLKNFQAKSDDADEETCDNVAKLYLSKHVKTEPTDEEFFPLGIMQGNHVPVGAKYSKGRGIWRRPKN